MRLFNVFMVLAVAGLCSCGGGSNEGEAGEGTEEVSSLPAVLQNRVTNYDMSEYFVNATFIIPDSSRGIPEVIENAFGGVQLTVGNSYNIVINEHLEGTIQSKTQELSEDLMYKNEIVEQGTDFILYKSVIADSYVDPVFHFYAIKTIGGTNFEIHDYSEEGGYAESQARFMLESVNHLQPNNPAS
ncbi:MAG: hypothetical protein R2813_06385 [Flavobacteriales bacterium]